MRILITADLHYDIARSRQPTQELARQALAAGGDALVLLGDSAGADLAVLEECLRLFDAFSGRKFLVPGNHCLWCRGDDEDSLTRYHRAIPAVAAACGFIVLDHEPALLGGVGLVGTIGWYDYSMRDESLGIPLEFYQAKMAPGAAEYLGRHDLVQRHTAELTDRQMGMAARWMDGKFIRMDISDEQFTNLLADRLSEQLAQVSPGADVVAAMVHHLPFAQLVPAGRPQRFAFAAAYMGSTVLGQRLLACPKVRYAYCGHSHWPMRIQVGHITAVSVGSTYDHKRLEILEL
jgi:predicted phosphohydrolase